MKRSERLQAQATDHGLMAAAIFSASVCAGVWSVRVWLSAPVGGLALLSLALAGLVTAWLMGREAVRLARLAARESRYEWEREIRPRL